MTSEYIPIDHFRHTDDDHSTSRIRDIPYGKRRESLAIFPTELHFANTNVDTPSPPYTVILTNDGYDIVVIREMIIVGDWDYSPKNITAIKPGEFISLQIAFTPRRAGAITGGLYLDTGDAAGVEFIKLSGSGVGTDEEEDGWDGMSEVVPDMFGAIGDGAADDEMAFTNAAAASTFLWLAEGKTYKIGPATPPSLVHGPGKIKFGNVGTTSGLPQSATVGGMEVLFNISQSNIVSTPDIWAELAIGDTASPGTGISNYFNTIFAAGSVAGDTARAITRSTLVGHSVGQYAQTFNRVDAFGQGAMRFAELANRVTAIGTIALQWLGSRTRAHLENTYHDWWLDSNNGPPGSPGWDFQGMETRNPGIGAKIQAWNNYPTLDTQASGIISVGRDSGLHLIRGGQNVFLGYQAGTNAFEVSDFTAIGDRALRDGVFHTEAVGVGSSAGVSWQEGNRNVIVGSSAARDVARGSRSTVIGALSALLVTDMNDCVILGYQAGQGLGTNLNEILAIQRGSARRPLIGGKFDTGLIGINGIPNNLTAAFHVYDFVGGDERFMTGQGAGTNAFTMTDNASSTGPVLELRRVSADPAANDGLATLRYVGRNSANVATNYVDMYCTLLDPTNGSEDSRLTIRSMASGTLSAAITCDSRVVIEKPFVIHPGTSSVVPINNGEISIEPSSNTSLTFRYKGSDGVVRSGVLTLA